MTLVRSLALAAATATLLASPFAAAAATMTLSKQDGQTSVFGSNGRASIVAYDASLLPPGGFQTNAGAFALKATPKQAFTDAAGNFTAFCLDIIGKLQLPSGYNETDTPFTGSPLTVLQKKNIRALFNTAYSTLNLLSTAQSAGFQLALWEIVNEASGTFNVNDGSFYVTGNTASRNAANLYLSGLAGPITHKYTLHYLEAEARTDQDLVTISEVPLPAAGWLLLAGLGGLAALRRRKQAA